MRGNAAFTLLEIIVAIVLILLIVGIAGPPAHSLIERQRFTAATDGLARAAIETRRHAIDTDRPAELLYVEPDAQRPVQRGAPASELPPTSQRPGAPTPFDLSEQTPLYAGGGLVFRAFDPSRENAAPDLDGIEGFPAAADLARDTAQRTATLVAAFDRSVNVSLPVIDRDDADADGDRNADATPWWRSPDYADRSEHPLLIVDADGLPLWSRPVQIELANRRAAVAFHPVSGEPHAIDPTDHSTAEPAQATATVPPPTPAPSPDEPPADAP